MPLVLSSSILASCHSSLCAQLPVREKGIITVGSEELSAHWGLYLAVLQLVWLVCSLAVEEDSVVPAMKY